MSDEAGQPFVERRYIPGVIDRPAASKTWRDLVVPSMVAGGIGLGVTLALTVGGRLVSGGETSAVLTSQVAALLDDNKTQNKLLQDLLVKTGDLYTRREAQADREAAERRFQSMEARLGDLGRRLETLETGYRFIQQMWVDRKK
jgi:hypothetical protein